MQNLTQIKNLSDEVFKKISYLEMILSREEQEDNYFRNMFQNKWNRAPSNSMNLNCYRELDKFKQKAQQARGCDEIARKQIMDNMAAFELLSSSREDISKQIPNKQDISTLQNSEVVDSLGKELKTFQALKDELIAKINRTFMILKGESVIQELFKVVRKTTTEQGVFEQEKVKYDGFISQIEEIYTKLMDLEKSITDLNQRFVRIKNDTIKPDKENDEFFKKIEANIALYNNKAAMLNQGAGFYQEFNMKLDELQKNICGFLNMREEDKRILLAVLGYSGGNHSVSYSPFSSDSYMDKNVNPVTNMSYQFHYQAKINAGNKENLNTSNQKK